MCFSQWFLVVIYINMKCDMREKDAVFLPSNALRM